MILDNELTFTVQQGTPSDPIDAHEISSIIGGEGKLLEVYINTKNLVRQDATGSYIHFEDASLENGQFYSTLRVGFGGQAAIKDRIRVCLPSNFDRWMRVSLENFTPESSAMISITGSTIS